jgi:hypothetical protein
MHAGVDAGGALTAMSAAKAGVPIRAAAVAVAANIRFMFIPIGDTT